MKFITKLCASVALVSILQDCGVITCRVDDYIPWSYHGLKNGPSSWGMDYTDCNGKQQSPVDIRTNEVVPDSALKPLQLNNYNIPVTKATIENNGITVSVYPEDGVDRSIAVNGKVFSLWLLHFHWGQEDDQGSEHTIDGKAFPLEAHFVHTHNSYTQELAFVSVLFQEVSENNTAFNPIGETLPGVLFEHATTPLLSSLDLNGLLPENPLPIYRYQGSFTTPPCTEGMIWSISQKIANIGKLQMTELRKLYSAERNQEYEGCKISGNFRGTQPLNGRKILVST